MILSDIARVHNALWPKSLELVGLHVEASDLSADISANGCCYHPGWVRFRSSVHWTLELDPNDALAHGPLLAAEWLEGAISVRIVPHPSMPGALLRVRSWEAADGKPALRQRVQVLARDGKTMNYYIYWQSDEAGATDHRLECFVGFEAKS